MLQYTRGKLAVDAPFDLSSSVHKHQANGGRAASSGTWRRVSAGGAGHVPALLEDRTDEAELARERHTSAALTLVYFDAGGGHRSVMNALRAAISAQGRPWEIDCLNLQELLDPLDIIRKIFGVRVQDVYNLMLKNGWTLGAAQLLPVLHAVIGMNHGRIVRLLENHWRQSRPDMVVSLIPHFNRQLAESFRRTLPGRPFVTVITDLADIPPHVWMERESEYLICGTERARRQAFEMGHPAERVFTASGMVVNPSFYESEASDRNAERARLDLRADLTTGLVLFGGQGSRAMLEIARRLDALPNLQLIFIAGRNAALERRLREMPFRIPVHVEGFTTRVPHFMQLADFMIGKPGPGSISEALVKGLPVIVECNAWTLPQERFNAEWILAQNVGQVVRDFRHIARAVRPWLEPATLARFQARAQEQRNRAVFEVPAMLASILGNSLRGNGTAQI